MTLCLGIASLFYNSFSFVSTDHIVKFRKYRFWKKQLVLIESISYNMVSPNDPFVSMYADWQPSWTNEKQMEDGGFSVE